MLTDRTKIMRKLHSAFKNRYELENPHKDLHLLAVSQFNVASMKDLSIEQLNELLAMVTSADINWKKLEEETGVAVIPEMTPGQKGLVIKLQKELGWSDSYLYEIAIRRFGFLHWKYLTGREAWAFCNYLIRRRREKSGKEKK